MPKTWLGGGGNNFWMTLPNWLPADANFNTACTITNFRSVDLFSGDNPGTIGSITVDNSELDILGSGAGGGIFNVTSGISGVNGSESYIGQNGASNGVTVITRFFLAQATRLRLCSGGVLRIRTSISFANSSTLAIYGGTVGYAGSAGLGPSYNLATDSTSGATLDGALVTSGGAILGGSLLVSDTVSSSSLLDWDVSVAGALTFNVRANSCANLNIGNPSVGPPTPGGGGPHRPGFTWSIAPVPNQIGSGPGASSYIIATVDGNLTGPTSIVTIFGSTYYLTTLSNVANSNRRDLVWLKFTGGTPPPPTIHVYPPIQIVPSGTGLNSSGTGTTPNVPTVGSATAAPATTFSGSGGGSATVTAVLSPYTTGDAITYRLYRSTTKTGAPSLLQTNAGVQADSSTFSDATVVAGNTYYYTVTAQDTTTGQTESALSQQVAVSV